VKARLTPTTATREQATPSVRVVPPLTELLEHPERGSGLSPDAARALLARLVPLQAVLLACAFAAGPEGAGRDQLLTVEVAARKLGQSPHWLYKHARALPFTVRNGRALRFSEAGIEMWIRHQRRV
jgi:hypothetical protein